MKPLFPLAKLSPAARRGLLAHLLHWMAVQAGSLYVSFYLFKLGGGGFRLPALYALAQYLAVPLGYWLGGRRTRLRGPASSQRLGLVVYALSLALILALGPAARAWVGPLGLLWGVGIGYYWQGWVLLMVDLSAEGKDRDALLGMNQACSFLANLTAAPLTGAFLAWSAARAGASGAAVAGYPWVFAAALALFLGAWLLSLPLEGRPQHGASSLKRLLKARKPRGWWAGMLSTGLLGVLSAGSLFLPQVLCLALGKNEGLGGLYTALSALAGLAASALVARLGHPERRGDFILWSALAVAALVLPLALFRTYPLLLVYGLGMAVGMALFNVPVFAAQIRIIESHPRFRHRRADAMLLREIPLNLGRVAVCAAVLWGVEGAESGTLVALLAAVALTPLSIYGALKPHLGRA